MFTMRCDKCKEILYETVTRYWLTPSGSKPTHDESGFISRSKYKPGKKRCSVEFYRNEISERVFIYECCPQRGRDIEKQICNVVSKFEVMDCVGVLIIKGEII